MKRIGKRRLKAIRDEVWHVAHTLRALADHFEEGDDAHDSLINALGETQNAISFISDKIRGPLP